MIVDMSYCYGIQSSMVDHVCMDGNIKLVIIMIVSNIAEQFGFHFRTGKETGTVNIYLLENPCF